MEKTLVILKPDAIRRGLVGEIISRIEKKNFSISMMKMTLLDRKTAIDHYSHIKDIPIFDDIIDFMTSDRLIIMVVEGNKVIESIRTMLGKTSCFESLPGTIRGDFGSHSFKNLIHASDSPENASIEIKRFFG